MARKSPYVSASRMYRVSRIPTEYFFLSFLINSIIVFFQFLWIGIIFIIGMIPQIAKILFQFTKLIYDIISLGIQKIISFIKK